MKTNMKILSILWAVVGMFSSCSKTVKNIDWQQTTKVVYRYSPPSIPPDFYRSFSVTVTEKEIVVKIRNYSETLLTKSYPNTVQNYQAFIRELQAARVKKVKEVKSTASGCDSESLSLYKGDNEFFDAYSTCGCGNMKVSNGDLEEIVKGQVPDLTDLINQTLKNKERE